MDWSIDGPAEVRRAVRLPAERLGVRRAMSPAALVRLGVGVEQDPVLGFRLTAPRPIRPQDTFESLYDMVYYIWRR